MENKTEKQGKGINIENLGAMTQMLCQRGVGFCGQSQRRGEAAKRKPEAYIIRKVKDVW